MDEALLSEQEVSARFRISVPWLRRARMRHEGPPFIKVGKRMVRYRQSDIEAFLNHRLVAGGRALPEQ